MGASPDAPFLPSLRPNTTTTLSIIFCSFVVIAFAAIIGTSIELVILYIEDRPLVKFPYGEIPTIEIETIEVSNFNLSNPITAHWKINMNMHSTDSSFEFSNSMISIFHESKDEALWMMSLKNFDMRPKNSTFHFALDFWGSSADVDDTTVRTIRQNIRNNHGAVEFNVQLKADYATRGKISGSKKFFDDYVTTVNMFISCDVLLIFESPDKTRAYMLKTKNQACIMRTTGDYRYILYPQARPRGEVIRVRPGHKNFRDPEIILSM